MKTEKKKAESLKQIRCQFCHLSNINTFLLGSQQICQEFSGKDIGLSGVLPLKVNGKLASWIYGLAFGLLKQRRDCLIGK